MPNLSRRECVITDRAIVLGLAEKMLKQLNSVLPWGAKKRKVTDYIYVLRAHSHGRSTLWMRELKTDDPVLYFKFDENIGALTSNSSDKTRIIMLSESELALIEFSIQQILDIRIKAT